MASFNAGQLEIRVRLALGADKARILCQTMNSLQEVDQLAKESVRNADGDAFCGAASPDFGIPLPGPGEQYRFHFDMTQCIGCKCCVVACNEQNGNPADILWRRVGEIEGGSYPFTQRHYLSIGCNHCLEPTCMTGVRSMRSPRMASRGSCVTSF